MILWKLSLREIRSHWGRTILTAASIVIGVAAVTAVNLAAKAVRVSFGAMQATIAGDAALEVQAAGEGLFEAAIADTVAAAPGVESASPILEQKTVMYAEGGRRVTLILLGIDPQRENLMRDYELVAGEKLTAGDQVLLDATFAQGIGLHVNDQVRLLARSGRITVTVAGLLKPSTGAAVGRGSVLFMPLATAQRRFRAEDRINRVQVVLAPGADDEQVRAAIAQRLPEGLTVRSTAARNQMGEETMRSLQSALFMATAFALVAAVFIVGNAFFMNVTQRHRQLAVMRAIGATRVQTLRLILREALIMALVGTSLGLAVGWGGAVLLSDAMEQLYRTDLPQPQLTPLVLGIAISVGVLVSLFGALLPAIKAALVQPVEGMHEVSRGDVEGVPRWLVACGTLGFVVSGGLLAANLLGFLPQYDYVLGAIVFLVFAVFSVFPLVLKPLAGAAAWVLRVVGRAEARIARQQLLRRQVRTTLTIGVLFVAASTALGLASTVMDNIEDVQKWYKRVMTGDFFLRALTPDLANWELAQIPEGVEEEVRAVPGIDLIFGVRFITGEVIHPQDLAAAAGGTPRAAPALAGEVVHPQGEPLEVLITARDFPTAESITTDPIGISRAELRERFLRGEVTIGSVLAQRTGVKGGGVITLQTSQGPKALPVAATINDYMAGGLVIHMDRGLAARLLNVQGVDAFVINAPQAKLSQVEQALQTIADKHGLLLQSYAQLTGEIDTMMNGVIAGLWVVLTLGLVVASLGVMNTLTMNVLEQTRELAMLRVVAMTRAQARKTVLAQAAILGSIGLAPGVFVGLGLSWLINRSLLPTIGREVAFNFHFDLSLWGLLVAMILVLLAAWFPAQRAANLEPIQALRYE